jgi:hypothetical protein
VTWESLVGGGLDRDEADRIRKVLLDSCEQDTPALYAIIRGLMGPVLRTSSPLYMQECVKHIAAR